MIDTKKAKGRILSLAFRGLLVNYPQKEKQNHPLDNLHRAQTNFLPVSEAEYLVEIPSHWNWSRLGYVTNNHGQTVPDKEFCYIDVGTLDNLHQRLAEKENLVAAKDAPSRARKVVHLGDVLYSTVRPYLHNICIVDREFSRTPIASTAFCVMQTNNSVLLNKFLFYWLLTTEFDEYSNGDFSKGTLYPAIGEKDLLRGVIPIPSLDEQSLIVVKIETAFSSLETIDGLQAQYADNLTVLKSKLIDAAIQGKLTEQLPDDGAADELYQQIQVEKEALAEKGELYREKTIKKIYPEDIPYTIPQNWIWTRLGELSKVITKGSSPKWQGVNYTDADNGILFITSENVGNGRMLLDKQKYVQKQFNEIHPSSILQRGDILTNIVGASIGRTALFDEDIDDANTNQAVCIVRLINQSVSAYILRYLCSDSAIRLMLGKVVDTARANLSLASISNLLVPLPPLTEQQRIIERLDEVLKLLEQLDYE